MDDVTRERNIVWSSEDIAAEENEIEEVEETQSKDSFAALTPAERRLELDRLKLELEKRKMDFEELKFEAESKRRESDPDIERMKIDLETNKINVEELKIKNEIERLKLDNKISKRQTGLGYAKLVGMVAVTMAGIGCEILSTGAIIDLEQGGLSVTSRAMSHLGKMSGVASNAIGRIIM